MANDKEREKAKVAKTVLHVVEFVDDMLPIVGKVMDLEVVDKLEERIVENIVDSVMDNLDGSEDPLPWSA